MKPETRWEKSKSALAIFVLMLSLAALQSPLWRSPATSSLAVRSGGAALVSSQTPVARVMVEQDGQATAEVVGEREVLVRGKAAGQTTLRVVSRDGHATTYRVVVESDAAESTLGPLSSR